MGMTKPFSRRQWAVPSISRFILKVNIGTIWNYHPIDGLHHRTRELIRAEGTSFSTTLWCREYKRR
jgi:hypothetical protein